MKCGQQQNDKFMYELSFGFIPRFFAPNAEERYILEEESDVTEIYFVMKGQWALAFNCFVPPEDSEHVDDKPLLQHGEQDPADMRKHGHVVAKKFNGNGYLGDYYVLGSKRSQFHYVALSNVETFALQK